MRTQYSQKVIKISDQTDAMALTGINFAAFRLIDLPDVVLSLPFGEMLRRALIRNRVDTSHSQAIIGKTVDGTPLEGHTHAHYLATDQDADGQLDYVTVYAPAGLDESDIAALRMTHTLRRRIDLPEVRLVLTGFGESANFPEMPLFAKERCWRSVTPFSLPRFASRGAGKPPRPRDMPEAQLVRELKSRGFPEPVAIKRIDGYAPMGRPMVRWMEFQTRRLKGDHGFGLAGFEIEFAEEVRGPIAVGFGCHFGLGLFLPVRND